MKILYILFFLAVYSNFALSAQEAGKDNITEKGKDQDFITYNYNVMHCGKPLFPGGYSRFIELFRKHTHYSQAIADTLSEDIRVIARITLDSTGKIIKREAWCKYDFFEKDVLSFLNRLPDFEIPSQTESCCYKLNLGFIYKTYKLVPKCFSQDFKMYDEDTLYREKPQFPGGYKNFTNLLRQYTHYSKAIADSLPKSVNVLARIALDRTVSQIRQGPRYSLLKLIRAGVPEDNGRRTMRLYPALFGPLAAEAWNFVLRLHSDDLPR